LVDAYIEEYGARGINAATVSHTAAALDRWGRWLKQRRPRVSIEEIDADLITRYIASCSTFRAKATISGTLSTMRCFGDYLVRQGLWTVSPLRWMRGPKIIPRKGKERRKYLVGRSEKRRVFWHYALEARPVIARRKRFVLVAHVVFSEDGKDALVPVDRMHSLRRQFCKNWWNDRWRDLMLAYVSWFWKPTESDGAEGRLAVDGRPMLFRAPISVRDTPDDLRLGELLEGMEWEELDEGEDGDPEEIGDVD